MAVIGAAAVPHPPLIIPQVGKGEEKKISATICAYEEAAKRLASLRPQTVVVVSPHSASYFDYFHISPGESARGDFGMFDAGCVSISAKYDAEFTARLTALCGETGFPAGFDGERKPALDHGTMIPLYFLNKYYKDYKLVRIGVSGRSDAAHYELGMKIAEIADELERSTVVMASGDMSHKLKKHGPYGFDEAGPEYDARVCDVLSRAAFGELFKFDSELCENAAECGQRAFLILAGALDQRRVTGEMLSYEGPFGVGYGVFAFDVGGRDESRDFLAIRDTKREQAKKVEDDYVRLARLSLETYIKTGKTVKLPDGLPDELLNQRAGAFVSLKIDGELRGCIGTISPTRSCTALEIIENAVSAGTRDPRFLPVTEEELSLLSYSVDVLGSAERIADESELDPKRYGIIVTKGGRRGLLLPDLEGVDTVEEQLSIAKRKAGIPSFDDDVIIERFEVIRHL